MRILLISFLILAGLTDAMAQYRDPGRDRRRDDWRNPRGVRVISVQGEGYYPDEATANGVCLSKGFYEAVGFTQWRQAGDKIQGLRSYDGSAFFQSYKWGGGMAIQTVSCRARTSPQARVNVRGQGYYPDELTANGVCVASGYYQTTGFTQWRQAGDKIEGLRSYDGNGYFQVAKWGGGMALDIVNCQ